MIWPIEVSSLGVLGVAHERHSFVITRPTQVAGALSPPHTTRLTQPVHDNHLPKTQHHSSFRFASITYSDFATSHFLRHLLRPPLDVLRLQQAPHLTLDGTDRQTPCSARSPTSSTMSLSKRLTRISPVKTGNIYLYGFLTFEIDTWLGRRQSTPLTSGGTVLSSHPVAARPYNTSSIEFL